MAKRISKKEIIEQIFMDIKNDTKLKKKDVGIVVDKLIEKIVDNVKKDNQVFFLGFGSFILNKIPKRKGVNPQTGKKMTIPAYKTIKFKPSKKIKESL